MDREFCHGCPDEWNCTLSLTANGECCRTCVYFFNNCMITGDLVHWCKAYAEVEATDRLAKLNMKGGDNSGTGLRTEQRD